MINLKYNDEFEIICNGIVDLGKLGKYKGNSIEINAEYDSYDIGEMSENQRSVTLVELNKKFNDFVKRVEDNIKNIENQFIVCFFKFLVDTELDFSDYNDLSFISKDCTNAESIFSKVKGDNFVKVHKILDNTPFKEINGYDLFNEYLPMIDINMILKSVVPHFLQLDDDYMEVEVNSDGELISSIVIDINEELKVCIVDC